MSKYVILPANTPTVLTRKKLNMREQIQNRLKYFWY